MALKAKLSKHGNSMGLVIPKPVLDLLGWQADEKVAIQLDKKDGRPCLVVRKYEDEEKA